MAERLMSVQQFEEANPEIETTKIFSEYTEYLTEGRRDIAEENGVSVEELHFLPGVQKPEEDAPTVAVS